MPNPNPLRPYEQYLPELHCIASDAAKRAPEAVATLPALSGKTPPTASFTL